MKQSQNLFNQEIVNRFVTKQMWKQFTDKEYKFIISLCKQKYPFTPKQNEWFEDILKKYILNN